MLITRKCLCLTDCIIQDILFKNKTKKFYKDIEYKVEICEDHYTLYEINSKDHVYLKRDFDKYFKLIK